MFTGVKFVTVNAGVLPPSASARQVDDTLTREFPPNRSSPLEVLLGVVKQSEQGPTPRLRIGFEGIAIDEIADFGTRGGARLTRLISGNIGGWRDRRHIQKILI